jgi:glutathione S-transferase
LDGQLVASPGSAPAVMLEMYPAPVRGDALSIADIAAASLLSPLVAPPGSTYDSKEGKAHETAAIRAFRAELSTRPGWAWVLARYKNDRNARAS